MSSRLLIRAAAVASFLVANIATISFNQAPVVSAQQTAFLYAPFYGARLVNSLFDHHYPTFSTNADNQFRRFDGASYTNPPYALDAVNCDTGVDCYDGHEGIDLAMSYERVLAAADGTVTEVQ